MVTYKTYKRKVNNETERYGGYAEVEVKAPQEETLNDSFMQAQCKQAEASVNYSTVAAPVTYTDTVITPDRTQSYSRPAAKSQEEIMPVIKKEQDPDIATRPTTRRKEKVDTRTKLVLAVYLSIIVMLSALVIATGIFLSSTGERVDALESELSVKNARVTEQLSDIARLNDEDFMTGRAYNNGMVRVEDPEVIELLPLNELTTYEGTTNWFDSFCDWLSGVFGG